MHAVSRRKGVSLPCRVPVTLPRVDLVSTDAHALATITDFPEADAARNNTCRSRPRPRQ